MTKVKQKISGCFRVHEFALAYCRISSYLQTMKYKGANPIVAISQALNYAADFKEGDAVASRVVGPALRNLRPDAKI